MRSQQRFAARWIGELDRPGFAGQNGLDDREGRQVFWP
jgi:hypothetical protein